MRRFALPAARAGRAYCCSPPAAARTPTTARLPVPAGGSGHDVLGHPVDRAREPTSAADPAATTPSPPTAPKAQIIIKAGNFASNPAVQGLVTSYPLYFQALVSKDDTVLKKKFPSFFYSDVSEGIFDAQRNGWMMRPPGSVVVDRRAKQHVGRHRRGADVPLADHAVLGPEGEEVDRGDTEGIARGDRDDPDRHRLAAVPARPDDGVSCSGVALSGLDRNTRNSIPNR